MMNYYLFENLIITSELLERWHTLCPRLQTLLLQANDLSGGEGRLAGRPDKGRAEYQFQFQALHGTV